MNHKCTRFFFSFNFVYIHVFSFASGIQKKKRFPELLNKGLPKLSRLTSLTRRGENIYYYSFHSLSMQDGQRDPSCPSTFFHIQSFLYYQKFGIQTERVFSEIDDKWIKPLIFLENFREIDKKKPNNWLGESHLLYLYTSKFISPRTTLLSMR